MAAALVACERHTYADDRVPDREGMTCREYMAEYGPRPREGTMSMKAFAEGYERYCQDENVLFKRK